VYIDTSSQDTFYSVINTSNGAYLAGPTAFNDDVNNDGRIDVTAINSTHFAINEYDSSGNDNNYYIYDRAGAVAVGLTTIDGNAGGNVDIAIAELGDRLVFAWRDPNNGNDLNGEIWDHAGGRLTNEWNIDGNCLPDSVRRDEVDIAVISSTRWVVGWFDDNSDNIRIRLYNQAGTSQAEGVVDSAVGGTGEVSLHGLRNNLFALAYYDSTDQNITIAIYDTSGDSFSLDYGPTPIDTAAGTDSRLDVAEVEVSGESYFVVAWWDQGDNIFEAAVYDSSGTEITAPFEVDDSPDATYPWIAATGANSLLDTSLCDSKFIVAYTNSSDLSVYKMYDIDGSEWDGDCAAEVTDNPPNVISLDNPGNNSNVTTSSPIDFNFTVTDDSGFTNCTLYTNITGSWTPNASTTSIINNTETNITVSMPDGVILWNIRCWDNATTPQDDYYDSNYTLRIDTTGPVTTIDNPDNGTSISSSTYDLNASVIDLTGISQVTFLYRENGSAVWNSACNDTDGSPYECTWTITGLTEGNDYQIRAYANDTFGTIGANDTHYNITITSDPVISDTGCNISGTGWADCTAYIFWRYLQKHQDQLQRGHHKQCNFPFPEHR